MLGSDNEFKRLHFELNVTLLGIFLPLAITVNLLLFMFLSARSSCQGHSSERSAG